MGLSPNFITLTETLVLLTVLNVILSIPQNAMAFSLSGIFNKLSGGFIQKDNFNKPKSFENTLDEKNLIDKQNINPSLSLPNISLSPFTKLTVPTNCHIVNGNLPDSRCTTGSVNPLVNQNNIKNTICIPGYSKKIRPTQDTQGN